MMQIKLAAILLGLLSAITLTQPATAQSRFQKDFLGIDTRDLSSRQRDRVEEIRDDLDADLSDVLSFDEIDELQEALDDGDDVDRAVDRLDLSDRRSRDVRDILRSAERDVRDIVVDRDRPDSIYAPGNWQRPVN
jgi:predicted phage gp36 major capsid-like protein